MQRSRAIWLPGAADVSRCSWRDDARRAVCDGARAHVTAREGRWRSLRAEARRMTAEPARRSPKGEGGLRMAARIRYDWRSAQ